MPVPRGQSSVLWELRDGNLTAAEAMVVLFMHHGSTWASGATWGMSSPYLSKKLGAGMSRRYVRKILATLKTKGWIKTLDKENLSGYSYRLRHYLCAYKDVPVDQDGKPLTFAVPRAEGGPIERCMDGDISWKAALAWISLKLKSNWKGWENTAGQTEQVTLLELSKRIRISLRNYQGLITELMQAGMLERLSPKSQPAIFQLYPMPRPKDDAPRKPIRPEWLKGKAIDTDGDYWYSDNKQYRCPIDDYLAIEGRQRGGGWKQVSDYHKYQGMPRAILVDFERAVLIQRDVNSSFDTS